jgi:hypothetical protein
MSCDDVYGIFFLRRQTIIILNSSTHLIPPKRQQPRRRERLLKKEKNIKISGENLKEKISITQTKKNQSDSEKDSSSR